MTNRLLSKALPPVVLSLELLTSSSHAATLAGQQFEDVTRLASQDLRLNGMGLRQMLFVKVYAAALYLPSKAGNLATVKALPGPKRLQLRMLHSARSDDFIEALLPGIRANSSPAQLAALAERVALLERSIRAIGHTVPGDVVDFDHLP